MKKVILIDVDDVVCENHFLSLVNEFLVNSKKPVLTTLDGFPATYEDLIWDSVEEQQAFYDFYLSRNSYESCKPIDGSVEAIKELSLKNDVYFITSCIHNQREREFSRQYADKFNWILDRFPFLEPTRFIASNKKHIFKADVIIDDRLGNLQGDYKTKILFTSFHNKTISEGELEKTGAVRANNWQEILDIIKRS